MLQGLPWALALLCAALMGLAMQRGATCLVVAVDEWLEQRRAGRAAALVEAALWSGTGLLVLQAAGWMPTLHAGYDVTAWTWAGAAVLGVGAVVNGGCVVGSVAKLGSGQWAYAATPLGFFLGCKLADLSDTVPQAPASTSPIALSAAPAELGWLLLAALLLRALWAWHRHGWRLSPHVATASIGIIFALLVAMVGSWAYTDMLVDGAQQMAQPRRLSVVMQWLLAAALFAGALGGGLAAGRWQWSRNLSWPWSWPWRKALRCLLSGALLGWGSLWVPGSNDSLLLLGLPLLWPHAWPALATMVLTIAGALRLRKKYFREAPSNPG
jgi:toxin CptA